MMWRLVRFERQSEESTAAGLYGTIVSAAVMAASHAERAAAVIVSVAVTLVIYWAAERYARLVAERIHDDRRLTWSEIRERLQDGWEVVTASTIPLVVLTVFVLGGADLRTAVFAGLVSCTLLLCLAGWEMGQGAHFSFGERVGLAVIAGSFGALMVLLKALLH